MFDIQQHCPVEALHTMVLAVTEYLVNDLCDFLTHSEVQQLESRLRNYQSDAFNRIMNTSRRLHRFFVGRDFKILSRHITIIFKKSLADRMVLFR